MLRFMDFGLVYGKGVFFYQNSSFLYFLDNVKFIAKNRTLGYDIAFSS